MTDEPTQPSDEIDNAPENKPTEPAPKAEQEVPPGMLPLVDPVFGDGKSWTAFLITAVPFLVYLAGTSLGAHLENLRKTEPVHTMRGVCRAMSDELKGSLETLPVEQGTELINRLELAKVQTALDDESSEVGVLVQQCEQLLTSDFSDVNPVIQKDILRFREFVQHFFELEAMVEEDNVDEIRDAYAEFQSRQEGAQLPELNQTWYPQLYSIACLTAFVVILFAMPGYLKQPFRITPLAIGVGVAGIFVWLGLWWLDENVLHIGRMVSDTKRAGFNPWQELADNPTWMYTFVGIRLLGLCLVIPIAEEFFARGFLMRYIEDIDWDQIPIGEATWKGLAGIIVYGAMTHPGEIVAAVAWFGLVTWMYLKTKNIWDCVIAHAITNALLAAYVITTGTWELW